jgi:hypothetical protein
MASLLSSGRPTRIPPVRSRLPAKTREILRRFRMYDLPAIPNLSVHSLKHPLLFFFFFFVLICFDRARLNSSFSYKPAKVLF